MEIPTCSHLPTNGVESFAEPVSVTGMREASDFQWYALRIKVGQEPSISERLRANGVPEFLPTYSKQVRSNDRTRLVRRALFPGYTFACFDRADPSLIWATPGVLQILGTDEASAIPPPEISSLRTLCSSSNAKAVPYEAGLSRVRITRGPFAGAEGVITRERRGTLLTVPVEILGRAVAVEIDAADTEPIQRKTP